ncbi:toxin-antitoxin system HicB family antitoxin [candidate division KSB1 bacterium]|nr:toxin-antitoxin system HicB family antitoxin [candidate division KSB1 bacterium]
MSTMSIRIPDSLHKRAKELANQDNVSMNQFITLALAEKISALDTENYLEERALRGSKEKFLKVLEKVKDVKPEEYDRLE